MSAVDARDAYNRYFGQAQQRVPLWDQQNARPSPQAQFELDVAFWYGTLIQGDPNEREFLKRVFTVLYYGGLLYYGPSGWAEWARSDIPIAAVLSHGGRVLIQLPRVQNGAPDAFLQWLQGPGNVITNNPRLAATHGIEPFATPLSINGKRWHRLNEIKSGGKGRHYGVNISLGGTGNVNPISGNRIASNGEHGHLYVYYLPPTAETYGGLLIGLEGSAPVDAWDNRTSIGHTPGTKGRSGKLGIAGYIARAAIKDKVFGDPTLFTPDQTGGYHKLGARQRYSPTGNAKWEQLPVGPTRVYNGMLVDLVVGRWESLIREDFTPEMLGKSGVSCRPPRAITIPPIITKTCLIEANLKQLSVVVAQVAKDTETMRAGKMPTVKDYNVTHTKKTMLGLRKVKDHTTEKSAEMLNPTVAQFVQNAILGDDPMDMATWQRWSSVRMASRSLLQDVDAKVAECLRLTAQKVKLMRQTISASGDVANDDTLKDRHNKLLELVLALKRYFELPAAESDKHTPMVRALYLLVLTELKLLDSARQVLRAWV